MTLSRNDVIESRFDGEGIVVMVRPRYLDREALMTVSYLCRSPSLIRHEEAKKA